MSGAPALAQNRHHRHWRRKADRQKGNPRRQQRDKQKQKQKQKSDFAFLWQRRSKFETVAVGGPYYNAEGPRPPGPRPTAPNKNT